MKKKYDSPANANAPRATPAPIPPFAPALKPEDGAAEAELDACDVAVEVTVEVFIMLEAGKLVEELVPVLVDRTEVLDMEGETEEASAA